MQSTIQNQTTTAPQFQVTSTSQNNKIISCTSKGIRAKQATETHTAATGKSLSAQVQQETDPITQIDKGYQQDRATPRVTGTDWYQCIKAPKTDCKVSTNQTSTT
jgi:hypothetical protein